MLFTRKAPYFFHDSLFLTVASALIVRSPEENVGVIGKK